MIGGAKSIIINDDLDLWIWPSGQWSLVDMSNGPTDVAWGKDLVVDLQKFFSAEAYIDRAKCEGDENNASTA